MDQSKYHYCKLVSFNSFDQEIYTSEDECSENDDESTEFKSKFSNFLNIKLFLQIGLSAFWAVILTGTFIKFF